MTTTVEIQEDMVKYPDFKKMRQQVMISCFHAKPARTVKGIPI